jgi:hypothetical protein
METREAKRLRDEPAALAAATADQLASLLTVLIRHDRFVEGELAGAYRSGLLTGILRRAAALWEELDADQSQGTLTLRDQGAGVDGGGALESARGGRPGFGSLVVSLDE